MFSDRINIQYSIDSQELPDEVQRLISKIEGHATQLIEALKGRAPTGAAILSPHTLQEVDLLRRRLAAMDYILSDVNNIVSSYLEYSTQKSQEDTPIDPQTDNEEDLVISQDSLFRDLNTLHEQVEHLNEK